MKLGGPLLTAIVQIYVSELSPDHCKIGYVTTKKHFARGIWSGELNRIDGQLKLEVNGIVCPTWLFMLGLPYARYLQLRAWRRAVEVFRQV